MRRKQKHKKEEEKKRRQNTTCTQPRTVVRSWLHSFTASQLHSFTATSKTLGLLETYSHMQLQDLNQQELNNVLTLRLEQQKQDLTTEQRLSVTLDTHNIRYQLWLHGNDLINTRNN